ncbi:UDP-2,4-diacetamido-2,4,6-trideoxy-beta-L-altropyranose hydrolase [Shewanella sp. TC10]|uniref:UDP-2,4-diacetamido-2,4, 6-trideoxy-beta-L-altropyranose hydrolase n=1 Tax=Shewanella sp. TC10 TaxID=1419739 RepID=UPI00129DD288|nr:UDP-2,4-diacetamido-2,4,6-trideoxy-beta-L-altropyranose hydrolase [Shewanella sp. TC10]
MKKIIFRVNAGKGAGVGHLVRCCALAAELTADGHQCIFLLANFDASIQPFLSGIEHDFLYSNKESTAGVSAVDAIQDARLTREYIADKNVDWLILDDYLLGKEWEQAFSDINLKLMVIDDLCREHVCDALLDVRWRGEQTASTYDQLVPAADKLIGPQYALLSSQYQRNNTNASQTDAGQFVILVGVGGGSDSLVSIDIINQLLTLSLNKSLLIRPILGPLTSNKSLLIETFKDHIQVEPIVDCFDLFPHLVASHLYIGAAGGVLYQLLALNKPAITFSIAENQRTALADLEGIGHYFHCDGELDISKLASLVNIVIEQYPRILSLKAKAVSIDGFGAKRVAQYFNDEAVTALSDFFTTNNQQDIAFEQLDENYRIRPVMDSDINHYLDSRNLPANAKNMIETKPIPRLGHYQWWLSTGRDSYLLEKKKRASLYIWQQVQQYQKRQFLIGGWFVCEAATSFQDALLALNWQLEYCDEHLPNIPWIAVIHRQNRYVKLMNDYLGFSEIDQKHDYFDAIGSIFANASIDDFYYVVRTPNVALVSQTTSS